MIIHIFAFVKIHTLVVIWNKNQLMSFSKRSKIFSCGFFAAKILWTQFLSTTVKTKFVIKKVLADELISCQKCSIYSFQKCRFKHCKEPNVLKKSTIREYSYIISHVWR
jgi:hypothetical protein